MKYVLIFGLITLATFAVGKPNCPACLTQVSWVDLKSSRDVLNKSLYKLAALDGPFYRLIKVNVATKQVASGVVDLINADLKCKDGHIKTCDVEIWSKRWLTDDITVTFNCPGEKQVVKTHSA